MAKCKIEKEGTYLDFKGAAKILEERGVDKTLISFSSETGHSIQCIYKWMNEAPEVVTMIYHFLKDNYLNFDDLVKESKYKKVKESKNKNKTELPKKIANLEKQLENLKKQLE